MTELLNDKCEACNNLTPKLSPAQAHDLLGQLKEWTIIEDHHLTKRWEFKNFAKPLKLVNAIAELAEREGHHPNISFGWGYLEIKIWTHVIDGLSKNDFILATKIDNLIQ